MTHEEMLFEEFLGERMRDKGVSLRRLADLTGIAPSHLENMLHGNFEEMPSAPYFRGYVIRVGKVLDFDGEEWWTKLRKGDVARNSGPADALPRNRFIKKAISKPAWAAGALALIIIIYLAFELPHIFGKPTLDVAFPPENPYTTSSSTLTLTGIVQNADALYLSNGNASSEQEVSIGQGGTWQQTVLLQNGLNSFELVAKKFLGSESDLTEQILYEPAAASSSTASSTNQ
jgi:cytoskeletal protein RodZ